MAFRGTWLTAGQVARLCGFRKRECNRLVCTTAFLDKFRNYEKLGVPNVATSSGSLNLDRVHQLFEVLGKPHHSFPVIHIAGTKGKGSSAAYLSCMLTAAGYRTGSYSSPHVRSIRERITVDSREIAPETWQSLSRPHQPVISKLQEELGGRLTHYEVLTALAMQHFSNSQVDIVVVEAGLGGRLDATNIFPRKSLILAIITALGLEHEDVLGVGLANIVAAKAGIMKQGRPVLLAHQPEPEAEAQLLSHASELGCPVFLARDAVTVEPLATSQGSWRQPVHLSVAEKLDSHQEWQSGHTVTIGMLGDHQCSNAATAVAAALLLRQQGWDKINKAAVLAGLHTASLPGRFQVTRLGKGNDGPMVVLDGAHTAPAAKALSKTLRQVFPDEPLALVIGVAADKDHQGIMQALQQAHPCLATFVSVPIAGHTARSTAPGTLAAHWQLASMRARRSGARCRATIQASIMAAVDQALIELQAAGSTPGVICICGSLHVVAEALNTLEWHEQ